MSKKIIYPNERGCVLVITPAPEFISSLPTDDTFLVKMRVIADKDVPTGVPYKIVDTADIPGDRTFRDAWEADFSTFDGHGG